jgi:hypothetical protein
MEFHGYASPNSSVAKARHLFRPLGATPSQFTRSPADCTKYKGLRAFSTALATARRVH